MTHPYFYNKVEADYLSKISIFQLKKDGYLKSYYSELVISWPKETDRNDIHVEINLIKNLKEYFMGRALPQDGFIRVKHQNNSYDIQLCTSDCNYGRFRYWLTCPVCLKRVGVVYLRGGFYACRECQCLTYQSRRLSGRWKLLGRIISIPEMETLHNDFKRKFYRGKPTRKFLRYVKATNRMEKIYGAHFGWST